MNEYEKMSGKEFELFIYNVFTKLGFRAQLTKASGDGGIDLIAEYDGLVFKGKYLIQCKRWKSNVGEPEVRDLYGTTISENALKGILVTTSSFTKQAQAFAAGKNIELIDGGALASLLASLHDRSELDTPIMTPSQTSFVMHEQFDKEKYHLLDNKIKENPNLKKPQEVLINFLLENIFKMGHEATINGLVKEELTRIDRFTETFAPGKKSEHQHEKCKSNYSKALLQFISGDFAKSFEELVTNNTGFTFYHQHCLRYVILNIFGYPSSATNFSLKLSNDYDRLSRSDPTSIASQILGSVLLFEREKSDQTFDSIYIYWPTENELVELKEIKERFKLNFQDNIEEQRSIVNIYGEG